ncbi:MAG: Rqc2 family fibronectin-binding protein [Chloroflexota bacterium]
MYLDVFTLSALVDEFMDTLVGGRVQDTIDVDATGVGLEIYADRRRHYLYISADNSVPRLHITEEKLRRGLQKPLQIGLLLRRYVEGGRVVHISQPQWERIVHFHIEGPEGEVEIIVEPMERRANILLVQGGVILDCVRRVGPEENRYRLSLPAHEYQPPPPQTGKREPFTLTVQDVYGFFDQATDEKRKTFQVLTGHVLGVSPLLAREIVFRASGDISERAPEADPDALFDALQETVEPLRRRDWQPGIAQTADEGITAYSVYPLTYLPGWEPVETVNAALVAYYGAPVGDEAYEQAKKPVRAGLAEARAKLQARLASLQKSLKDDAEREALRKSGELILAYQYTLDKGQGELRAQYAPDEPELVISLDPKLTPLENAQNYFTRYNKAKRALEDVPALIEETRNELEYIDQLETDLEMAGSWPDIDDVQQALQSAGYWKGKQAKRIGGGGQSAPLRVVTDDGFVLWVGRNSRQNEIVTFKKARGDDFWLHARGVPGAHVIIKNDGRRIPDDVVDRAAALAAYYSRNRGEGRVAVDMTRVKYVKKIKGAAQGMVTYRNEQTLTVTPESERN